MENDIRLAIDETQVTDMENFQEQLRTKGIMVERVTDKTIIYRHLETNKKVRGSKLGDIYDKRGIMHGFESEKQLRRNKYESKSTTSERTQKIKQRIDNLEQYLTGPLSINQPKPSSMNENAVNELEQREQNRSKENQTLVRELKALPSNFKNT